MSGFNGDRRRACRERKRRVRESNRKTIPVALYERDESSGDWIVLDLPAGGVAPHMQPRMSFKQFAPKLDVRRAVEITEIMPAHRKAARMIYIEKRDLAL